MYPSYGRLLAGKFSFPTWVSTLPEMSPKIPLNSLRISATFSAVLIEFAPGILRADSHALFKRHACMSANLFPKPESCDIIALYNISQGGYSIDESPPSSEVKSVREISPSDGELDLFHLSTWYWLLDWIAPRWTCTWWPYTSFCWLWFGCDNFMPGSAWAQMWHNLQNVVNIRHQIRQKVAPPITCISANHNHSFIHPAAELFC